MLKVASNIRKYLFSGFRTDKFLIIWQAWRSIEAALGCFSICSTATSTEPASTALVALFGDLRVKVAMAANPCTPQNFQSDKDHNFEC